MVEVVNWTVGTIGQRGGSFILVISTGRTGRLITTSFWTVVTYGDKSLQACQLKCLRNFDGYYTLRILFLL